jgi:hypothetical protein
MSTLSIGSRDRRTLVVGIVAVGLILGIGRGLPAWRRWDRTARVAAEDATRELASIESGKRELTALRNSAVAQRRQLQILSPMVLEGASPAEAGALLAAAVTDAAEEVGAQIGSVQIRPDTTYKGNFARVAVRLSATADVTSLAQLLNELESGELLLNVRELTVNQAAPAAPDNTPEALRFELLVEGLAMHPRVRKL